MNFIAPPPTVTVSLEKTETITAAALPSTTQVSVAATQNTVLLERAPGIVGSSGCAPDKPSAVPRISTEIPTNLPSLVIEPLPEPDVKIVAPEIQSASTYISGFPQILPSATYAGPDEPIWANEGGGGGGAPTTWSEYPALTAVDFVNQNINNVGTIFFDAGLTESLTTVGNVLQYNGDPLVTGTVVRSIGTSEPRTITGAVTFTGAGVAQVTSAANNVQIFVPAPTQPDVVDSLNTLKGALSLTSTTNSIVITPGTNTIDLGVSSNAVVTSTNGLRGDVVLSNSDGSVVITPDPLTDKINLSAPGSTPANWANFPAVAPVDLAGNALKDTTGGLEITSNEAFSLAKNRIDLLANNGVLGGAIGLTAGSGLVGTNGGLIDITANGGSQPLGLFGQVNITANPGTANVGDTPVTTGGAISLLANSGGSFTTATSKITLNAGGINIYSGIGTPFGSLFGYTYLNASLGISLVAGAFTSGLQAPGTVYLYGDSGITLGSDTTVRNIFAPTGSNLTISGRGTGERVFINEAGTFNFSGVGKLEQLTAAEFSSGGTITGLSSAGFVNGAITGLSSAGFTSGAITGLDTINGVVYPPPVPIQSELGRAGGSVVITNIGSISVQSAATRPVIITTADDGAPYIFLGGSSGGGITLVTSEGNAALSLGEFGNSGRVTLVSANASDMQISNTATGIVISNGISAPPPNGLYITPTELRFNNTLISPSYQATYYKSASQNLNTGNTDITFNENGSWNNPGNYISHTDGTRDFFVNRTGLYQLEFNVFVLLNSGVYTQATNKLCSIDITRPTLGERSVISTQSLMAQADYTQCVTASTYLIAGDIINMRINNVFTINGVTPPQVLGVVNTFDLNTFFSWRFIS